MPAFFSAAAPDFAARFAALLSQKRETADDVSQAVANIIADVQARGDQALFDFTRKFDRFDLGPNNLRVTPQEIAAAKAAVPSTTLDALTHAATRIEAFHARHKPVDDQYTDEIGVTLGARWTPVDAAGLYVPGGLAAYPSSVLMNAIPARLAGVRRLVAATPAPDGKLNPIVLAAADLSGVTEIYRIGGAQAIAALAYGTATIAPVDKIVGPGNAYVAAAKRHVFGQVGIDSIAGPSEVLIVADKANDPAWLAADLLAQAEHDEAAQSILITDDEAFGRAVAIEVERQLAQLPRQHIARASWEAHGAIIIVKSLTEAPALADRIAPEHLQLCVADPHAFAARVRHAGAIFLGAHTPEAIGDYVGGPNHVLPTARAARFSSGLSVLDFMKRTTIIGSTRDALAQLGESAATLADAEGLSAHAHSIRIRLNR
ncbi:MAG: histidinol dehydrogenase [Alphaproteobacteria bacterium]|nr:histidinol dehydrogenase [Alphaproteobacteria bacterium]